MEQQNIEKTFDVNIWKKEQENYFNELLNSRLGEYDRKFKVLNIDITNIKNENTDLRIENDELRIENSNLNKKVDNLMTDNAKLNKEVANLNKKVDNLMTDNDKLKFDNADLNERILFLEYKFYSSLCREFLVIIFGALRQFLSEEQQIKCQENEVVEEFIKIFCEFKAQEKDKEQAKELEEYFISFLNFLQDMKSYQNDIVDNMSKFNRNTLFDYITQNYEGKEEHHSTLKKFIEEILPKEEFDKNGYVNLTNSNKNELIKITYNYIGNNFMKGG